MQRQLTEKIYCQKREWKREFRLTHIDVVYKSMNMVLEFTAKELNFWLDMWEEGKQIYADKKRREKTKESLYDTMKGHRDWFKS